MVKYGGEEIETVLYKIIRKNLKQEYIFTVIRLYGSKKNRTTPKL